MYTPELILAISAAFSAFLTLICRVFATFSSVFWSDLEFCREMVNSVTFLLFFRSSSLDVESRVWRLDIAVSLDWISWVCEVICVDFTSDWDCWDLKEAMVVR